MLTGTQIRMARAALKWSLQELAACSNVHFATVQRAEQADGIPHMRVATLFAIKSAFEAAGCEFLINDKDRSSGVSVLIPQINERSHAPPERHLSKSQQK